MPTINISCPEIIKLIATRFARQSRLMGDVTSNDTITSFDNWFKPEDFGIATQTDKMVEDKKTGGETDIKFASIMLVFNMINNGDFIVYKRRRYLKTGPVINQFTKQLTISTQQAQRIAELEGALRKAVDDYGKPGGPWNVPSEPGTWIDLARKALTTK